MVSKNMPTAKVTSIIRTILFICMASLIAAIVLLCLVPPVSRDALTHHLAVPKLYMEHGGIHEIPSIPASYNPMNLDLLYLIPLYFGNDITPKFIHLSFALLTAWLIFWLSKGTAEQRICVPWGDLFPFCANNRKAFHHRIC